MGGRGVNVLNKRELTEWVDNLRNRIEKLEQLSDERDLHSAPLAPMAEAINRTNKTSPVLVSSESGQSVVTVNRSKAREESVAVAERRRVIAQETEEALNRVIAGLDELCGRHTEKEAVESHGLSVYILDKTHSVFGSPRFKQTEWHKVRLRREEDTIRYATIMDRDEACFFGLVVNED